MNRTDLKARLIDANLSGREPVCYVYSTSGNYEQHSCIFCGDYSFEMDALPDSHVEKDLNEMFKLIDRATVWRTPFHSTWRKIEDDPE